MNTPGSSVTLDFKGFPLIIIDDHTMIYRNQRFELKLYQNDGYRCLIARVGTYPIATAVQYKYSAWEARPSGSCEPGHSHTNRYLALIQAIRQEKV